MHFIRFYIILVYLISLRKTDGNFQYDYSSSTIGMKKLFDMETIFIQNFQNFIKNSENLINSLKSNVRDIKENQHPNFESNIVGEILKIKTIHDQTFKIENIINQTAEALINSTKSISLRLPSQDDITGILQAISRLQETYDLTIDQLLGGKIEILSKFSYSDCYKIGVYLHNAKEYHKSIEWFMKSVSKYDENINFRKVMKEEILEYMSWTHYKMGDNEAALRYSQQLFDINSTYPNVLQNIKWYKSFIKEGKKAQPAEKIDVEYDKRNKLYYLGCRGQLKKPNFELSKLHCRYLTENHPFLMLARVKIEELSLNPKVRLYHDVIYDSEINHLKQISRDHLTRALVWDVNSGSELKSEVRTSSFAWLDNWYDDIINRVVQRIEDMTNLKMSSYEKLQIANYGIGGHYSLHHDFHYETLNDNVKKYAGYELGNRIATLMFYMSTVQKGGATVFPYLNITIWPHKGSAAFWYNLHAGGEPDYRTMHAACPVIEGDKWVSNQWIHEREQELRRPCELFNDNL